MAKTPQESDIDTKQDATSEAASRPKRGRPSRADRLIPEALRKPYEPQAEGKLIHYGIMPDSPLSGVVCGQVSFQKTTYIMDTSGNNDHQRMQGIASRLTADQIKKAEAAIGCFVVKVRYDDDGNVQSAHAEDTRWKHYVRQPDDDPLAYHVFMTEVDEGAYSDGVTRPPMRPLLERE